MNFNKLANVLFVVAFLFVIILLNTVEKIPLFAACCGAISTAVSGFMVGLHNRSNRVYNNLAEPYFDGITGGDDALATLSRYFGPLPDHYLDYQGNPIKYYKINIVSKGEKIPFGYQVGALYFKRGLAVKPDLTASEVILSPTAVRFSSEHSLLYYDHAKEAILIKGIVWRVIS